MNKTKIPKNWVFKYFEVDGNTTKFVYEDQLGIEHIYIDEKPEPELPTYEELQDKCNKQKEVLDKIREYCKEVIEEHNNGEYNVSTVQLAIKEHKGNIKNILELLEEIE